MRLVCLFMALAGSALAGEYALLASGGRIYADRHEVEGSKVRLFAGAATVEMNADQVTGFEREEVPQKPAQASEAIIPAEEPAVNEAPDPQSLADAAADKYKLPRWLVRSVMRTESGFNPKAISPKGAIGLMQLMPATAQALGADPHDAAQNADAGARHLRELLDKYDGQLWHALAAYNAGAGALEKYNGIPPYQETIQYINRIHRDMKAAEQAY
jgi:soluble lytic murein transglycosylase-like protein